MTKLIEGTPEVMEVFQAAQSQRQVANLHPLLKHLLLNTERNAEKLPQQRRHEELLKKFSTSLFIYAGPMAYDFPPQVGHVHIAAVNKIAAKK